MLGSIFCLACMIAQQVICLKSAYLYKWLSFGEM